MRVEVTVALRVRDSWPSGFEAHLELADAQIAVKAAGNDWGLGVGWRGEGGRVRVEVRVSGSRRE